MKRVEQNGISYLQFDLLLNCQELFHAVFLRQGGVSKGPFESLNLAYEIQDQEACVQENLKRVKDLIKIQDLVYARQVHKTHACLIENADLECIDNCDSLMTQKQNLALMIKHADCQAAIFYDPINRALSNVHCGWKGNVQNIYAASIQKMQSLFGTKAEDLLVAISPSLGPNRAEFLHYKKELPQEFWQFEEKKDHFNLWEIAAFQLKNAGVLKHHIEMAKICTFEESSDFFSYRREKICGRHGTLAAII